ncbi:MAG: ABC transporter permease [Alphaproteobacteria bacterium]|nr:ABC transporter permease [Alphaproteobacteria bacterium]
MMRERFTGAAYAVATFAVLLAAWEIACDYFKVPVFYIPAPSRIGATLIVGAPLYLDHLGVTLYATLASFAIAMVLGVVLGTLVSEIKFFERTLQPVLIALQAMPRIALAPIIIVWFGFGPASKIALGAFTAFFPVFVNTAQGMRATDSEQIALMRSLKASRWQIFRMIKLPNAMPYLLAGASIAIIFAMLAVIVGEFLGSNRGMGYLITTQSTQMDTAGVMATVFILSAIGVVFHYGLQFLRDRLLFWAAQGEVAGGGV